MGRSWIGWAGVALALFVAGQVGYVRATRTQDRLRSAVEREAQQLTARVGQLETERLALQEQLARAERENERLSLDVANSSSRTTLWQRSTELLRSRVDELHSTLREEPPPLEIAVTAGPDLELVAEVHNVGGQPLWISDLEGRLWQGQAPHAVLLDDSGTVVLDLEVEPDGVALVYGFPLLQETVSVDDPSDVIEGVLCIAYQRAGLPGAALWVERVHLRYERGLDVQVSRWGAGPRTELDAACDVENSNLS